MARQKTERTQEQNFVDKLVSINRVTKVVKGGKNMSFSALVVAGDEKGRVGYGLGKAREVPDAINKAKEKAQKKMVKVPLREGRTIHHDLIGHFGSGHVIVRSAPPGTGIKAGGPMRAVFEVLGIQDIVAKSVGSTNPHNMVKATFDALLKVTSPRQVAARRNKKIAEIIGRRHGNKVETQVEAETSEKGLSDE